MDCVAVDCVALAEPAVDAVEAVDDVVPDPVLAVDPVLALVPLFALDNPRACCSWENAC